jgi:hypothetical protein
MTSTINPAINGHELLQQQKQITTALIELGASTLKRCSPAIALPPALEPLWHQNDRMFRLGLMRQELVGAIVARNPREYDDTPEAAVRLADDLLILFNITSRA